MLLTQAQINKIYQDARDQLHQVDPLPILESLNLNIVQVKETSYKLNLRNEDHASAFISLKNNRWVYKDFGDGSNGTIENVVMLVTRRNYKDALTYCLSTLNNPLYASNSPTLGNLSTSKETSIEAYKKPQSIVTKVGNADHYPSIVTYLSSRGILKIPPCIKAIEGVYYNKNNEPKKVFGVGVLNNTGGADIHFLKKIGGLKTMNLWAKDVSLFKNTGSHKLAIFESKMDYAAAYQNLDFSDSDILIANSTSNLNKVVKLLKEASYINVNIFQQNDQQGRNFAHEIVKQANLTSFNYIKYEAREEGLDVNDLLQKGVHIQDRVISFTCTKQLQSHHKRCRS